MWLNAVTSIVIGPGLGRDPSTFPSVECVLKKIEEDPSTHLVGDADFLWYLSNSEKKEDLLSRLKECRHRVVLTPNVVEFSRLA